MLHAVASQQTFMQIFCYVTVCSRPTYYRNIIATDGILLVKLVENRKEFTEQSYCKLSTLECSYIDGAKDKMDANFFVSLSRVFSVVFIHLPEKENSTLLLNGLIFYMTVSHFCCIFFKLKNV